MEEIQTITTIDEDGKEVKLKLIDLVNVDDFEYALLLPEDADPEDEEAETVLMRFIQKDGEYTFEEIEDDDEFDLVAQAIMDDNEARIKD